MITIENLIRDIIREEIEDALEELDVEQIVQDKVDEINPKDELATKEFVHETIQHEIEESK